MAVLASSCVSPCLIRHACHLPNWQMFTSTAKAVFQLYTAIVKAAVMYNRGLVYCILPQIQPQRNNGPTPLGSNWVWLLLACQTWCLTTFTLCQPLYQKVSALLDSLPVVWGQRVPCICQLALAIAQNFTVTIQQSAVL